MSYIPIKFFEIVFFSFKMILFLIFFLDSPSQLSLGFYFALG